MMFNVSSERACSVSIGEYLRDAGISVSVPHFDLWHVMSHLVFADRDGLARAQSRGELELVAHALGRIVEQQVALVVVAHLEDFRRCLLAFHISLAQLLIDNDLHRALSFLDAPQFGPGTRSYKRIVFATRSANGVLKP